MPIDKLIPRYLNKDDDYLLVKTVEMVDALNIQTADDEGGNAGVVKNALGNVVVSNAATGDALSSGTNTVIGTASSKQTGQIFYFVYNSNNQHSIYEYTSRRNTVKLVYRDPVLNFTATGFVKADCLIKENGDTLLYFTDGVTDPKKINATKALANTSGPEGYPLKKVASYNYSDEQKLLSITTIKAPPTTPPIATFISDTTLENNNVSEKLFQFAYQYIYEDGEISAISPYSEIALDDLNFFDYYTLKSDISNLNAIKVTFKYSPADVSKIRVLYREGTLNNFSVFANVNNNRSGFITASSEPTGSVNFYNNDTSALVSDNEMNKMYDSVPISSVSQVISGNRLAYANYKEFYDNTEITGSVFWQHDVSSPSLQNFKTSTSGSIVAYPVTGTNGVSFSLDLTDLQNSSIEPVTVNLNFAIKSSKITLTSGNTGTSLFTVPTYQFSGNSWRYNVVSSTTVSSFVIGEFELPIQKTFTVNPYADKSVLASSIIAQITGTTYIANLYPTSPSYFHEISSIRSTYYYGGSLGVTIQSTSGSISVSGNVITLQVLPNASSLNIRTSKVTQFQNYIGNTSINIVDVTQLTVPLSFLGQTLNSTYNTSWSDFRLDDVESSYLIKSNAYKTFKSGQSHDFGIVYYDAYNRSSAVNEIGTFYNPSEGEREYGFGKAKSIFRINNSPPSWAKKWQIVYSPYSSYSFSYRYSVAEAFLPAQTASGTVFPSGSVQNMPIYLAMRHLEGKDTSSKEANGILFDYSYAEGDKLRIVSYTSPSSSGTLIYPKNYIFDIDGYEYITSTGTLVVSGTAGTTLNATQNRDYRATGLFLKIKNENYPFFTPTEISGGTSFWGNDCVIEIYRPIKKTKDLVYREIAVHGNVVLSGGVYYHETESRDYRYSLPSGSTISTGSGLIKVIPSGIPVYPGDGLLIINRAGGVDFSVKVESVITDTSNKYIRLQENSVDPNVIATYDLLDLGVFFNPSGSLISYPDNAIIETNNGDCYYRPRRIKGNPANGVFSRIPQDVENIRYFDAFVEDLSVSDFYESKDIGIGRPNSVSSNAKQIVRKPSITYSEPYSLDTSVLKLSSFNGGQGNFVDLPNAYGAINYMINNGDTITVLQEVKSSVIPINRNLVEYADGSTNVTISTNYLGNQSVYAGDYGTQNPESVMSYKGRVYFADVRSGKIVRIGGDGIEPISENKIDSYTQDKCFIIASASGVYKVIGGIDPMHNEYLVTYTNVSGGTNIKDTIAYDTEDKVWNTRYSFVPEAYENMDNYMYTFKDGSMHRHTDIANRNEFYGDNYDSTMRLVSAFNNSMVKTAEAFSIEGNHPWSFKFQTSGTTAQETVTSSGSSMILKEGAYYLNVPKSISASTTSNRTVIGYVAATGTWASGATITLGNPIVAPFQVSGNTAILCLNASGATVSTLTNYKKIEQVDRNTIQLSNVSGATPSIATGTILVVDSLASVDGDSIRGPYFLIDVTVNYDLPIEAYAFNVYFSRSKLHNELVTQ
jgi:hypothetical protein